MEIDIDTRTRRLLEGIRFDMRLGGNAGEILSQ
jgi:hypothetical protein